MGELLIGGDIKKVKEPAEPLSKRQQLNNHVVCMRNGVRQARVQIINRLISQIQKYKNRKGNPKEQEKAKRRAVRILAEIQILKKIKKDKVSLYSLQTTQRLDEVLNNTEASTEERVLARLAHHPIVLKDVNKYRDANPHWDKQIPVLLNITREKRRKKKESLSEEPEIPLKIEAVKIKQENSREESEDEEPGEEGGDLSAEENISDEDEEELQENSGDEEALEDNEDEVDLEANSEGDEEDSENNEEEESESEDDKEETVPEQKVSKSQPKPDRKPIKGKSNGVQKPNGKSVSPVNKPSATRVPVQNKSEGTVKVKFLTNLNELEEEEDDRKSSNLVDITKPQAPQRPKSGFFVGGVDEPEPEEPERPPPSQRYFNQPRQNGNQSNPVYRKGKLISKPPPKQGRFADKRQRQQPSEWEGRGNKRFGGNSEPLGSKKPKFSNDSQRPLLQPAQIEQKPPEKLHPSWEAKKKQQVSLTEFKGKKIVFDDDD